MNTALELTVANPYSDIETDGTYVNPILRCANSLEEISFYQTKYTLTDVSVYKQFIDNIIGRFRKSRFYKSYKSYLMNLGLDKCQIFGNINSEMADIELHHNFITIFDIALMITEHLLATIGYVCTYDIILLLQEEHKANRVPIVMLSKTVHDLYHNEPGFYINTSSTFGKWWELFARYRYGITMEIAYKVQDYVNLCINNKDIYSNEVITIGNTIKGWSDLNVYGMPANMCGYINDNNSGLYLPAA